MCTLLDATPSILLHSRAYGIPRNETKRNKTKRNLLHMQELTSINGTKNYSLPRKLSSPIWLVSQNTNGGRLVIGETRLANYFYKRFAFESYMVR